MKCPVCGAQAHPHYKACPRCWRLCNSRHPGLPVADRIQAAKNALDKTINKFRCEYTGVILDLDDPSSPFYAVFDHIVPGERRLVLCARLVNEMKRDLTGDEFRTVVLALSDFLENGTPFDPNIIKFVCWPRRFDLPVQTGLGRTPPSPRGCAVCGMKRHRYSLYCDGCRHFIFHKPEHVARVAAMRDGLDRTAGGFRCHYSGVLLDTKDRRSPWYMTFDHRFPGRKGNLAVCAAWINYMKTYLTEEQFRVVLKEMADHFRLGTTFNRDVLDVKGYRMAQRRVG